MRCRPIIIIMLGIVCTLELAAVFYYLFLNRRSDKVFAPLRGHHSLVLFIIALLSNILSVILPTTWAQVLAVRCSGRVKKVSSHPLVPEIWCIFMFVIECRALFWFKPCFSLSIAVYGLVEAFTVIMRDIIVNFLVHRAPCGDSFLQIRNRPRWLVMAIVNVIQVVVCFAILFLYYGKQFTPRIYDPITALYQSAMTFATLGYGDIRPLVGCTEGKVIVCLELFFFILFLGVKLPAAISVVRIKCVPYRK